MHKSDKPASGSASRSEQHAGERAHSSMASGEPVPGWLDQLIIRPLSSRQRPVMLAHLLSLSPADRYLRFGYGATDEQIGRYVSHLNFERDALHGVFCRKGELVAMSHLAFPLPGAQPDTPIWCSGNGERVAEFGVSVLPAFRGQGVGSRLYAHAVRGARAHGMDTLLIHALSKNAAMLRIVSRHGACIVRHGPDAKASLKLAPGDWRLRLRHLLQSQVTLAFHALLFRSRLARSWLSVG